MSRPFSTHARNATFVLAFALLLSLFLPGCSDSALGPAEREPADAVAEPTHGDDPSDALEMPGAADTLDSGSLTAPPCLLLSEYIEGSSFNKALEVYNCGQRELDLTDWSLCLYSEAATDCGYTLDLTGTLTAGRVLTVCHPSIDPEVYAQPCDLHSKVANHNGDDRIALLRNGLPHDAFGELAVQPDEMVWKDLTLLRDGCDPFPGDAPFHYHDHYNVANGGVDDFTDLGEAPGWTCP